MNNFIILIFILIIIIFLVYFYYSNYNKKKEEPFSNYQPNLQRYIQNVFHDDRRQKEQTYFKLHSGFSNNFRRYYYNPNNEFISRNIQAILNQLKTKQKFDLDFKSLNYKLKNKIKNKKIYHEWENEKIMNINNPELYNYWDGDIAVKIDPQIYSTIKKKIIDEMNTTLYNSNIVKSNSQKIKNSKPIYTKNIKFDYKWLNNLEKNNIRLFTNYNDNLINILSAENNNQQYLNYIFILDVYRPFKFSGYQIYFEVIYNLNSKEILIKQANVLSPIPQQDLLIFPGYDKNFYSQQQIYYKYPDNPYQGKNHEIRTSEQDKILASKKQTSQILQKRKMNNILQFMDRSFSCYGSTGNNYYQCTSDKNILNRPKSSGIWDKPCIINEECPFYLANKNYLNDRGGCVNGFCEMPINVERLTYRNYNLITPPFCHNCKNNNEKCCNEQKTDKKKYPNLITPDYAFSGDFFERYRQKELLEKRGLNWINIS